MSFSGNLVSTGYRVLQYKYMHEILQNSDKHTHMINIQNEWDNIWVSNGIYGGYRGNIRFHFTKYEAKLFNIIDYSIVNLKMIINT